MYWHQTEETYYALFGENVTESLRNCIVYDTEIESVYLAGKFGVYSHDEFEVYDRESVCAGNFYSGEVPQRVSEITTGGFPFHHAGTEDFVSPALFERFDLADSAKGEFGYRLLYFYLH